MPARVSRIELKCETCRKSFFIREAQLKHQAGRFCSVECNAKSMIGNIPHNKGKTKENYLPLKIVGEKESRTKKRLFAEGKLVSSFKGKRHTKEAIEKNRKAHIGKVTFENAKRKIREKNKITMTKFWQDPKYREMMTRCWKDEGYKERRLRIMIDAQRRKPNKSEILIDSILQQHFPNEFKYTGDGKVIINGHIPDFVNCNGQKKIIEFNGIYWHLQKFKKEWNNPNLTKEDIEKIENTPYKEFGYHVLFIWEDELKDKERLIEKIKNFAKVL